MSEELKNFFNKIKDSQDFFLLRRLYNNPSSVIGNKQDMDEAEKEYYKLHDYFGLMMNNNLTEFIQLALHDSNISWHDDLQAWRKLNFFLYDSIDFKKYYHILDDPDVLPVLTNKIPIQEFFRRLKSKGIEHPMFPLFEMGEAYQKYKRLFAHHYPSEQVDNYDDKKAKSVRIWVNFRLQCIKERTIDKEEHKRNALKWIETDDYSDGSDLDNTYLYRYQLLNDFADPYSLAPGLSLKVFDNLVCENRFLDIIEHKLDEGTISGIPLDNALNIIMMGLRIKKYQEPGFLRGRLGEKLVRDFDWHRAEDLVSRITLYKIQKQMHQGEIVSFQKG